MQRSFSVPNDISRDEYYNQVFDRVQKWLDRRGEEVMTDNVPVSEMQKVDVSISQKGEGLKGVIEGIDTFMANSVRTHNKAFMNQFWGGHNPAAFGGEIISTLCQTSMYTYELAPFAIMIELEMLRKMAGLVGPQMKDASGVFTTGGSNGNMLGMLMARQRMYPDSLHNGFDGSKHCVFVSAESHYSVLMAGNVIGLGYNNIVKVKTDNDGRMIPSELQKEIENAKASGKIPLAVVGTAGTTVRGCFDPFKEISAVCKKNDDIWFHIDGAWGGSILFSPKYRHHADGADLADSICWDIHKMMGIPLMCSSFITKDIPLLTTLCGHSKTAHYLLHKDQADWDLGHRSLQCGRRNDALKGWLEWKEKGDEGFARVVEGYIESAAYFEGMVNEHPKTEMMSSRVYANVNYRYNPTPGSSAHGLDLDEINTEIRNRLL